MPGLTGTLVDNEFDLESLFLGGENSVQDLPFNGFFPTAEVEEEDDSSQLGPWRQISGEKITLGGDKVARWRKLTGTYRPPIYYPFDSRGGGISFSGHSETAFVKAVPRVIRVEIVEPEPTIEVFISEYSGDGSLHFSGYCSSRFNVSRGYSSYGVLHRTGKSSSQFIVSFAESEWVTDPHKRSLRESDEMALLGI